MLAAYTYSCENGVFSIFNLPKCYDSEFDSKDYDTIIVILHSF